MADFAGFELNSGDEETLDTKPNSTNKLTQEAESYLGSVKECVDPKLKREKQKLADLLDSYKKLIEKYDVKSQKSHDRVEQEKKLHKIPEIYAILHPELYKNPREEEKKKLQKFSKRVFSEVDRVVPRICRTPTPTIHDSRQEEKDRFIKIISSCPARFHNLCAEPIAAKKLRRPLYQSLSPQCYPNVREVEKERLSKILASSDKYYRKRFEPISDGGRKFNDVVKTPIKSNGYHKTHLNQETRTLSLDQTKNMVRVGEYSPLSSKGKVETLFGYGEDEGRRHQIMAERRKDFQDYLAKTSQDKIDKDLATKEEEENFNDHEEETKRSRSYSTSTQTENLQGDEPKKEEIYLSPQLPSPDAYKDVRRISYLSPREKLMADLHGISNCFPGASRSAANVHNNLDTRSQQAAYARALEEQIMEKRKIDEERKNKEREEEKAMEEKLHLQQEKLQNDYTEKQLKKQDWIAQRQSQEEVLRRKMVELELEARELKKEQRRKRSDSSERIQTEPPRVTIKRPQVLVTASPSTSHLDEKLEVGRGRYEAMSRAPLLDADRQNILSIMRSGSNGLAGIPGASIPVPKPMVLEKYAEKTSSVENKTFVNRKSEYEINSRMKEMERGKQVDLKINGREKINFQAEDIEDKMFGRDERLKDREKVNELLRAPLDFRIDKGPSPVREQRQTERIAQKGVLQASTQSGPPAMVSPTRPASPPIPAIRTRKIINNNTKFNDDKWQIPKRGKDLERSQAPPEQILTQLGAFRRHLQEEHMKLEARLQDNSTPATP